MCDEDREENELSLKEGFRSLSAYKGRLGTKFWIITEADFGDFEPQEDSVYCLSFSLKSPTMIYNPLSAAERWLSGRKRPPAKWVTG